MAIDGISPALSNTALNLPRAGQAAAADVALANRQQGVVDRAALQTALTSTVVPTPKTSPDPTLAQTVDRNGDGKITPDELSSQTAKLADTLFDNLRQSSSPTVSLAVAPPATPGTLPPPRASSPPDNAVQLGNPGRVMELMNLMDLASSYGPNGKTRGPSAPGGQTLDVSA
ncbi:MAG: hypothetical protein RLZZ200_1160 [Pseudomonadota bacterium]|jgi:hypothetical protein